MGVTLPAALGDRPALPSLIVTLGVATVLTTGLAIVIGLLGPYLLALVGSTLLAAGVYAFDQTSDRIVGIGSVAYVLGVVLVIGAFGTVAPAVIAGLSRSAHPIESFVGISPVAFLTAVAVGFTFLGLSLFDDVTSDRLLSAIFGAGYAGSCLLGLAGFLWGIEQLLTHIPTLIRSPAIRSFLRTGGLLGVWFVVLLEVVLAMVLLSHLRRSLQSAGGWRVRTDEPRIDLDRGVEPAGTDDTSDRETDQDQDQDRETDPGPDSDPDDAGRLVDLGVLVGGAKIVIAAIVSIGFVVYPMLVWRGFVPPSVQGVIEAAIRTASFHFLLLAVSAAAIGARICLVVVRWGRVSTPGDILHDNGELLGPTFLAVTIIPLAPTVVAAGGAVLPRGPAGVLARAASQVGAGVVVLGSLGVATVASIAFLVAATVPLFLRLVPDGARGQSIGSVCLLLATFAAALNDAPMGLVFGGVAATVFTWDVGENATSLARQMDSNASTLRGESIKICSSGVVATLAVGLTYLVSSTPRFLAAGVTPAQLLVALLLSVAATIGFLLLLRR